MTIYFLLGLAIGAIVPTVVLSRTVFKGLAAEVRDVERAKATMKQANKELNELRSEVKKWTRSDLPYDAMGDYSDLNYDLVSDETEIFPKVAPTGQESPDEWYRGEFGGQE